MNRFAVLGLVIAALVLGASTGVPGALSADDGGAGDVTVYRDGFGVPHIYGDTPEAAAYALRYVQAQDHLEQMRLNYLTAAGRLAEFGLGSADNDNNVHRLHVPQTAQASYQALVPEHRARIDAFVAGINRYIYEEGGTFADWISYVQPYEVLAWMHYLAMAEQSSKATGEMNAGGAGSVTPGGDFSSDASNMWAVSPSMSALGVAMLEGNPHVPWTEPTRQWYEAHLNYPGTNVAGSLVFGFPFIVMGANDNVAWMMTNNAAAAEGADIYAETVNPGNPSQYLRDGQWVNVDSEIVTIKEKVGEDIVEQTFTNDYSVHGPIIGSGSGVYYAAAMSSFDNVISRVVLFDMNEATSIFTMLDPTQPPDLHKWNMIGADRAGDIGYIWSARIADKPEGIDWSQPVDGSTSANDWGPLFTVGQMPQTVNPSWGYLQNANNSASTTAPNLNPNAFPSYIGGNAVGHAGLGDRGTRAVEILESRPQHSIQDMITMAFDSLSVRARMFIPVALDIWVEIGPGTPDPNGNLQAGINLLAGWDFVQDRESPETALGRLFIDTFYDSNPSFSAYVVPPAAEWTQADKDKLVAALQESTDFMLSNVGQLDPLWGDVHEIKRGSQLFGVGGGNNELQALHMAKAQGFINGAWRTNDGSSYIFTVAFTEPITFYSIRPLGQSEDPASPHYADQTQLFVDEQVKQVWMTLADVQANAEASFSLSYDGSTHNTDGDGCLDVRELGPDELLGGRRDPTNPWDYFNPTGDGQNRVDDILAVVEHYYLAAGEPGYSETYDRSAILETALEPWRFGPPSGRILVDDILHAVHSYYHDCG
jgi:acyl-homoserine lactone acylase PvdQ